MAQSLVYRSSQNSLLDAEDKFANAAPIEGNNTPVVSYIPTLALVVAPATAPSSIAQYSKNDFQRIFKTVSDSRSSPAPAPIPILAQQHESPWKRLLKAWFPDIYWGKIYMECYNFFSQCKNHFITTRATRSNRVLFAIISLNDIALFCWQQY